MVEYARWNKNWLLALALAIAMCLYSAHSEPLKLEWDDLGCQGNANSSSPLLPSSTSVGQCGSAPSIGAWRVYACSNVSFQWTDYDNDQCVATYIARDSHITGVCINNYRLMTSYAYVCDVNDTVAGPAPEVRTSNTNFQNATSQCSQPGKCQSSFYFTYYSDNQCETARSAVNNIGIEMKSSVCYNQPSDALSEYTTSFECVGNLYVKKSYTGNCDGTVFRTETTPTNLCRPSAVSAYAKATCINTITPVEVPTPVNNAKRLGLSIVAILALIGILFGL